MVNAVVRFADYRTYEAKRVDASNAMMGLLAGAQLASHLLQLTAGSERLLPEVFPRVRHIRGSTSRPRMLARFSMPPMRT